MTYYDYFVIVTIPMTIITVVKGLLMLVEKQDRQD